MKTTLLLLTFILGLKASSSAQHIKYSSIPYLKVIDFQGKPKKYIKNQVAYTTCNIFSNPRLIRKNKNTTYVKFVSNVVMRRDLSWIDMSLLKNKSKLDQVLEHERGHLIIAYIIGFQLQKKLSKTYAGNYQIESKILAKEIFQQFRAYEDRYDKETTHGNNKEIQNKWNMELKSQLPL